MQVQAASAGSLLDLAWSPDGTSVAAACGSGAVLLAALLGLAAEDGRHVAVLESERHVSVTDVASGIREELDFKDPVLHLSLGVCVCMSMCTCLYMLVVRMQLSIHRPLAPV